jgi:hypothetical protein
MIGPAVVPSGPRAPRRALALYWRQSPDAASTECWCHPVARLEPDDLRVDEILRIDLRADDW